MANLSISGDVSGSVTLSAPAIAGSPVVTLPNTTGTLALVSQATGGLIRAPQVLTSGTSYTTPVNCSAIYVEAVGGGGGGARSSTNPEDTQGAGGGSGAYCAKYFSVTGNTSYSYVIGSGGTGSNATLNATVGSNTTFTVNATTITAGGGGAGERATGGSGNSEDSKFGGAGGTALNGDFNVDGNPGQSSVGNTGNTTYFIRGSGGMGGASFFGGAGRAGIYTGSTNANATGSNGTFGGGGGGGGNQDDNPPTVGLGGNGGNGVIRIWEFI